ncbi:unnamed protein product, partial [Iphiclides podalirius]
MLIKLQWSQPIGHCRLRKHTRVIGIEPPRLATRLSARNSELDRQFSGGTRRARKEKRTRKSVVVNDLCVIKGDVPHVFSTNKDNEQLAMYTDLPKITRCCFCLPLRYGLLVWAYLKMIWCILVTVLILEKILNTVRRMKPADTNITMEAVIAALFLFDIAITLVFIVGAHKKNPKLLRVYYKYAVGTTVIVFLFYLFGMAMQIFMYLSRWFNSPQFYMIYDVFEIATFGTGTLLLNLYLLALIKNEILKLENSTQLSFYNHGSDSKCVLENV